MAPLLAFVAALAMPAVTMAAAIPPTEPSFSAQGSMIVGGVKAEAAQFPYIVSLAANSVHSCGGSLLDANTVVTAAHCTVNRVISQLTVRAGSNKWNSGGVQVKVASLATHPNYNANTYDNDVAIWRLASPIVADNSTIAYVDLAPAGSDPVGGSNATVAGWGTQRSGASTSPIDLYKVDLPVISRAECQASYPRYTVSNNMICAGLKAGGVDSCQGDSGGPFIDGATGELTGIVSWGIGCAAANQPGVYTRVANYIDWITTTAASFN